jgi:chromosome transmission fidelity protein 18
MKRYTPLEMRQQIGHMNVGIKDLKKDWKDITECIFKKERGREKLEDRMRELAQMVQDFGDYDRLIQACFENYLSIPLFDISNSQTGTETRYVQQGSFLAFYDIAVKQIFSQQHQEMYQYLPYCVTSFHRLFSTSKPLNLEYPRMGFNAEQDKKQIYGAAVDLWTGMSINNQSRYQSHSYNIMELAPYLLSIISPDLKPTNLQLLRPHEKKMLERVVELFIGFGLNLETQKTDVNTLEFILTPRLDFLVDLWPFCNERRTLTMGSYAVNQLIQHHVDTERVRIQESLLQGKSVQAASKSVSSTPSKKPMERAVTLKDIAPTQIEMKKEKVFNLNLAA